VTPISQLDQLLRNLQPRLRPGVYAFCLAEQDRPIAAALASFREDEGLSLILPEADALAAGLAVRFRAAWISLTVASDLEAVGLTAAVARVLAGAGIACNVVAAVHHDHLFVPVERAQEALACLQARQSAVGLDPAHTPTALP
jgi:uncharacterized protein